jgi:hypothetical protein
MTTYPQIIGLYSSVPASGKTTVASFLVENHGYTHLAFAGPLKKMIRSFLESAGYSATVIDHFLSPLGKEVELPGLHRATTRHLMQTLGTEWGRNCVSPDVWAQLWYRRASALIARGERVVCDDVRFPEEAAMVHSLSGELWRITRPSHHADPEVVSHASEVVSHASEGALESASFHRIISNSQGLEVLEANVARCLRSSAVEATVAATAGVSGASGAVAVAAGAA